MGLFNKKERKQVHVDDTTKHQVKELNYHPKIILAWAKAIEGNQELLNYLRDNGYTELFMATYAIKLADDAREWLMKNGYPHLMAFINAAEGNAQAVRWLQINRYDTLYYMADAIDGEENGKHGFWWIKQNCSQDIFLLTKIIKDVKDEIEDMHNDVHTF